MDSVSRFALLLKCQSQGFSLFKTGGSPSFSSVKAVCTPSSRVFPSIPVLLEMVSICSQRKRSQA